MFLFLKQKNGLFSPREKYSYIDFRIEYMLISYMVFEYIKKQKEEKPRSLLYMDIGTQIE